MSWEGIVDVGNSGKPKELAATLRLCGIITLFLVLISNSVVCTNAKTQPEPRLTADAAKTDSFDRYARVMLFSPTTGEWVLATFGQTVPGREFYFNNQLYRAVDSEKAQVVPNINAAGLFESDRACDKASRPPGAADVVQVLDKDWRFVAHTVFAAVQPDATIRFRGKVYIVREDRSLADTATLSSAPTNSLQPIEITESGLRHVIDRHTAGGTMNAGKSIFHPQENIQALIMDAQLATPVLEANGYLKRVFDAGRYIGMDGQKGKQTSMYRVITTQSGKLVTAYPVLK